MPWLPSCKKPLPQSVFTKISDSDALLHNQATTGLGFSRPKPVFPVQNGINWDKPVFPSFSRPKLGKTVQNWEKLLRTIFQAAKSFQKCVSNKNLIGQTRSSFHNTVETLYNTVNFCWSTHKRHSIARPKGRGMGCLLWVQRATYCVDLSKLSSIEYLL